MRLREPAICLRTTDFSETSQIVHFLTRTWGVARMIAKGTKRPKSKSGGAIDLLSEGDLVFMASSRQTLGTLIEFSETVARPTLRKEAGRLDAALYAIELAGEMLAEADPHAEVFDLLHSFLARLEQAGSPVQAVLAYFQWRLLRHVGLLGELDACVSCGEQVIAAKTAEGADGDKTILDIFFSSRQGGLLCAGCETATTEKYRLDAAALTGIATLRAVESGTRGILLPEKSARALNRLLSYHVAQQLGKQMRMARHAIP